MQGTSPLSEDGRGVARKEKRILSKALKGALEFIILATLRNAPSGGYEIMSAIHMTFGILLSPGTVYDTLRRLNDQGLIEKIHGQRGDIFKLSREGEELVQSLATDYMIFYARLSSILRTSIPAEGVFA